MKANIAKVKALHGIHRLAGGERMKDGKMTPREAKIEEDYKHFSYYVQKMRQNRTPYRELRAKINAYRRMIRKPEEKD